MTFDWLSRFRKPGPTREGRGPHHPQRPPMMITRKRPAPSPQVRPQVRPQARPQVRRAHPPVPVPVPRAAPPMRKGPIARPPARPQPPQRGHSKSLQCLHIHFHPNQKRDLAYPPIRPSKYTSSQQAPPFPPPRGASKPPPRHVHWAPAQAKLPDKPYPYPSQTSSSSHSQVHPRQYQSPPPPTPRYQPPPSKPGSKRAPYRSG